MTASVVILTRNAGAAFRETLEAVSRQVPAPSELVVVDTESADGTPELARSFGARVHAIRIGDFDFGRTRDLAFSLARGDLLLSLSQDVIPRDATWLAQLTAPFADPRVALVSARCEARDPETMFLWQRLGRFYFTREMARFRDRYGTPCSHANSCTRRSAWDKLRHGPMPIAEDLLLQKKLIEAGYATARIDVPTAWHQHRFTVGQVVKRAFNEGHAFRLLDVPYSLADAVRDTLRPDLGMTLLRQVRYGRVRSPADLLYPILRPAAVLLGHRRGRRYWR